MQMKIKISEKNKEKKYKQEKIGNEQNTYKLRRNAYELRIYIFLIRKNIYINREKCK